MPKEGDTSVTIKTYIWDDIENYFKTHKERLRKKGIKSATAVVTYCLSHFREIVEKLET